ncbi:pigment epithelium-derived factor isoform X2 [Synchiropus splendidus]|uniref:pigment epithelium-derived factor isoform X2 n=1 Tax=Synchiropus splendidus TaxID=270530 RepID=UPI00237D5F07|nr:pigment epithelium-derived factor isoform X2 [Synchiropus splendidus]
MDGARVPAEWARSRPCRATWIRASEGRMKRSMFLLLLLLSVSLSHAQSDAGGEEAAGEEEHVELFTTPTTKMAAATSDFGYNLFRALARSNPTANIFLSPISVSAVLTQLSLGASAHAQSQLFRALRYHNLQDAGLHNTLKDLLASLRSGAKGLSYAARIYLARRLRLKQDFFQLVEQQYGVRPKPLQGGSKDLKEINDWVSQQTDAKVQRFLSKPLPRNSGVNTVSASYFKGKWVTRFGQTGVMDNFQLDSGASVRVPMMQQDNYPVKMGVDPDLRCTVALSLPTLRLSYSTDLLPLLGDIGLAEWLANTDLERISLQPAKLSSVNHKVVLETAPEGNQYPSTATTAHSLSYRVDRPFLFLIRDESSGALLFIGQVVNPKDLTM